jgi:O-antigen ligase
MCFVLGTWIASFSGTAAIVLRLGAVASLVVVLLHSPRRPIVPGRKEDRFFRLIVLFAALALASTLWSSHPQQTLVYSGMLVLIVASVYLVASRRWGTEEHLSQDIVRGFFIISFSCALVIVAISGAPGMLPGGVYGNVNTAAMMAAITLPVGVGLLTTRQARRWTIGLMTLLTFVSLWLTASRTSLVAAVVGMAVVFWQVMLRGRIWRGVGPILLALPTILLFMVVIAVLTPAADSAVDLARRPVVRLFPTADISLDAYTSYRLVGWETAVALWREHPAEGHGFRTSAAVLGDRAGLGRSEFLLDMAHNGWLQLLLELGVAGGLVMTLVAIDTVLAIRHRRTGLHAGLQGAAIAGWSIQMGESSIVGVGSPFLIWFLLLLAAVWRLESLRCVDGRYSGGEMRPKVRHAYLVAPAPN